jgi:arsenate reductase
MTLTIWHNPRCSKSRQTLALLTEHGKTPDIIKYLDTGPTADQIRAVLTALNIPAIKLMRTGEKVFKELNLSKSDTDETLINAMASNPILIERPIVINGNRAAIGRPPEGVLDII